jgi:hypothetical protein
MVAVRQDVVVTTARPVAGAARPAPGAVLDAVLERITYAGSVALIDGKALMPLCLSSGSWGLTCGVGLAE